MTKAQEYLLEAAKSLMDYESRKENPDFLPKGMYEEIGLKRLLRAAIRAVEQEAGVAA